MLPESVINDSPPERRFQRGMQKRRAKRMVRRWNRASPSGTAVKYWNRYGDPPIETATRGEAFLSAAGLPVVCVERISGYVSLFHILPAAGGGEGERGREGDGQNISQSPTPWLQPPIVAEAACDVQAGEVRP